MSYESPTDESETAMTSFKFNGNTKPKRKQPSAAAKQRVRDAFDGDALKHLCETWDFSDYAQRIDLPSSPLGRERYFWFQDNGSDILAVAHLDSVQDDGTASIVETSAGLLVTSGKLDDRLGVYVILELLPARGINVDWLLTTDEEIGQSTAEDFTSENKDYNWIIQFDRGGTDVVMYDYETPELVKLVEQSTATVGLGSFSDICMLEHLGVAGFNWGVGYRDYHSPRSHAWLEDTFKMVARFEKFHRANHDKVFTHEPRTYYRDTGFASSINGQAWGSDFQGSDLRSAYKDDFYERLIVADCAHMIDVEDADSYVEISGGNIVCNTCGDIEALLDESA